MSYKCYKCGTEAYVTGNAQVGRQDSCPKCNFDLHCCRNCKFYDRSAYNECREPQAERVVDKERRNFCDYFHFSEDARQAPQKKADPKKALEDLFK